MDELEAMAARHSVRSYKDDPLPRDMRDALNAAIRQANDEGGIQLALVCDEPKAFSGMMARYGKFEGVRNYIVCAGAPAGDVQERIGFYGERVVLEAQRLGLNTCWVGLTYGKGACKKVVDPGCKLACAIALGFGSTQGIERKTKSVAELSEVPAWVQGPEQLPAWFEAGMKAAQLAPTAMNQQKFLFTLEGSPEAPVVSAKSLGGFYASIDLGIARCHFEIGANALSTDWAWA